jgi:lactoylglutathione lyase
MVRVSSIDHINMTVKDLAQSVEFYAKLFGFRVTKDQPDMNSKIIGNGRVQLCLYEGSEIHLEEGLNHFGFHVENFNEIEATCKKLGVPILYRGPVSWEEGTRSLYITDPSGYTIELSETAGGGLGLS